MTEKNRRGGIVKYIQLADKYTRITTGIAYVEDLIKHDSDLALVRQLEQLRKEQKEIASVINCLEKGKSEWVSARNKE